MTPFGAPSSTQFVSSRTIDDVHVSARSTPAPQFVPSQTQIFREPDVVGVGPARPLAKHASAARAPFGGRAREGRCVTFSGVR